MSALPEGWELKVLKDLCLPVSKSDPAELGRSKIRYIDIGSVDGASHSLVDVSEIDAVGAPSRCRQIVKGGDTVFSTVRPYLEKIAYVDDALADEFASTGFSVLRPGPSLLPKYLYYFSISPSMLDQVIPYQKGVSYPAVLDKEVRAATVPVPPLDAQRRVVALLDDHLSRLDAAEHGLRLTAARTRRLRESALLEALEIARAHPSTRINTIGDLATVSTGITPLKANKVFYDGGAIPWITSGDLSAGVVTSASHFVTERALLETNLKLVKAGAILLAMYGEGKTRGTVALLELDATTNQACAAIQLHEPGLRTWVKVVLDANYAPDGGGRGSAEPEPQLGALDRGSGAAHGGPRGRPRTPARARRRGVAASSPCEGRARPFRDIAARHPRCGILRQAQRRDEISHLTRVPSRLAPAPGRPWRTRAGSSRARSA